MKTRIELLLEQPEGKQLEFKMDLSSVKNIMKTFVSFANSSGGTLIIGIVDGSKEIVGIDNPLDEEERLCSLIADSISPRLVPNIEMVTLDGRTLLIIDFYDHLPQAVGNIMMFLKKHAMRGADFSEVQRKDVWSIPLTILREVVINALVHTDYSQRGAPIRIAFFDDRIEIENPGILLPGMTIKDMKQGVSKIRNPVIARVFRELDLIEQWGSGVPRIFKEAEDLKLPEPEILEIGTRVRFIVKLIEQIPVGENQKQATPLVIELLKVLKGDMGREQLQEFLDA